MTAHSSTATQAPGEPDDEAAEATPDTEAEKSPYTEFISKDAETGKTTIFFRGENFTFPTSRSGWPTKAMQTFQRGKMSTFPDGVELMLGEEQWDLLNDVAPTIAEFWEFFWIFAEAVGFATRNGAV